ncbi:MAG TPA: DNA repair protein RecO [Saprospiraceae bacterium]|nr:DNA repair protein RecO [Saprospiraceae bacterium]HMQ85068.1 DNA repair protein RecO [Saprospiraceae bacterium]
MLIKTRGIVFRTTKYSETSIIADIFTEEKGLRGYIVSGVRTPKSKISPSLLQLMSLVEIVAYDREDKKLNRIQEIKPAYLYSAIPFEVQRSAIGQFLIEVCSKAIREPEEQPDLFDFLFHSFVFLDQTKEKLSNLHLAFLVELSAFLGFLPQGQWSKQTPCFDLREGLFCPFMKSQFIMDENSSQVLSGLLSGHMSQSHLLRLNRHERKRLLGYLLDYYHYHLENFATINAHHVLEQVLED